MRTYGQHDSTGLVEQRTCSIISQRLKVIKYWRTRNVGVASNGIKGLELGVPQQWFLIPKAQWRMDQPVTGSFGLHGDEVVWL